MTKSNFALLQFLIILIFTTTSISQTNPSHGSITPRVSNTLSVWEQEVNYKIEVILKDDLKTIDGVIDIEYINNSPDKLKEIYLKAFPNAVQKDSYADLKKRSMNDYSFAELKPEQEGSLNIFEFPDKKNYRFLKMDNTILTIVLLDPLLPSDTIHLSFKFKTVLPSPGQLRMGYDRDVTRAAYWYPQVCVYDRKFGWVNSQYVGWGESYGDFGSFDVKITAPENQLVAATGVCVNESEVLPEELRNKYDISNFLKPKSEWPDFNFDKSKTKTWHYKAEKSNDFVFSCSDNWCLDADTVNGVEVSAYALRHKAKGWVDAVKLGKEAIATFSDLYYPYPWPVMRICDAFGGMEFPMLTNCSGSGPAPYFSMLLYHEIGHQWFMGFIGSNQLDRPFLDEGFTTHMEHVIMEKYYGRQGNYNHFDNWYERKFSPDFEDRNVRGFRPLMLLMKQGYDKPLSFSFDKGDEYFPYRVSAYYKSAAMHYSLRSIFGDTLYFDAMRSYCNEYAFHHPYEDDFTKSMEDATSLEMDNYLEQWYYSKKRLDYAYAGKSKKKIGRDYHHVIKLKNKGEFITPIDIAVVWEQGDTTFYTVAPEGMQYAKSGFVILPAWEQFRRLNNEYEFTVKAERDIKKVIIDPFNLLLDIDRLNNSSGFFPSTEIRLDNMKYDRVPVNKYALRVRPDFWYSEPSGLQIGFHSHGSYLEIDRKFSLDFRVGTEDGKVSADFEYKPRFAPFGRNSYMFWRYLTAEKRIFISTAYEKKFKKYYSRDDFELFRFDFSVLDMAGESNNRFAVIPDEDSKYLITPLWDLNYTTYLQFYTEVLRTFRYGSYYFKSTDLIGQYKENNRFRGFEKMHHRIGISLTRNKKEYLNIKIGYLNYTGEPPSHFLPHLSKLSEADQFIGSKIFRSPGTYPVSVSDDFYAAGDGVRGYQDRMIYYTEFKGSSIGLTPPDFLPFKYFKSIPMVGKFLSKLDNSFFFDIASITMEDKERFYPLIDTDNETLMFTGESDIYISAGLSITMPPVWSDHKVRLDFPFYLNKPVTGEKEFEFRFSVVWLIPGIN